VALVFVDDGSTDGTPAILADLAARSRGMVRVLTLNENVGKARAVQLGVQSAFDSQPDFVGYWDADLATPLSALREFLDVFDRHPDVDIVMGARVKLLGRDVSRSPIRHYSGRVFATAASMALGIGVYDTQCGAKVFRVTEPVRQAFAAPFRSKWIFDVEILARYVSAMGRTAAESRIFELPLKQWTAVPGSKLRLTHAIRAAWDLAVITRR
jgi:glycosyltransferase involved in cell wall biosynthesis